MDKKKSNNLSVCIICGILTAFGIVASLISLTTGGKGVWMAADFASLVVSLLIGYYAFIGYRKPHGNLLKYTILIATAIFVIGVYQLAQLNSPRQAVIAAIMIGLGCYIAGRLHRVKQNIIFLSVVVILRLITMILSLRTGILTIGIFTPLIIWIDIFVAYVLRYKEHKEAGLIDAPTGVNGDGSR